MEPIRREMSLLSGLGIQLLVITLLVFCYTQAARQRNYQRDRYEQLKEQMIRSEARVLSEYPKDLDRLQAEVEELMRQLPTREQLLDWTQALERAARERFGFQDLQVKLGPSEKTMPVSFKNSFPFEVDLLPLELRASATTQEVARFLADLKGGNEGLLCSLESMEMKALEPSAHKPVGVRVKWLIASASRIPLMTLGKVVPPIKPADLKSPGPGNLSLDWGWREEPFLSVTRFPSAIRIPAQTSSRFQLNGILWDPAAPTCTINGSVLKLGDSLLGYQLILITPTAVILQKGSEEILLSLS